MKIPRRGASGFPGGLVSERLARDGHQIACLVRNPGTQNPQANVYGPGQREKRQFAIVPTHMLAITEGSTWQIRGNGEATRDYLYADDFPGFFVLLTKRRWQGASTFNLASQKSCSINDLCKLLQKISSKQLKFEYRPARGIDSHGDAFNCACANTVSGRQATTGLEEGLEKTWEWFVSTQ